MTKSVIVPLCKAGEQFRKYGYQDFVFLIDNIIRTIVYHMNVIKPDYSNVTELLDIIPPEQLTEADKSELLGFFYNISFFSNYPELKDKE